MNYLINLVRKSRFLCISYNQILHIFVCSTLGPKYEKQIGIHSGGDDLIGDLQPGGRCGFYNKRSELEESCSKNSECVGYSMTTTKTNNDAVAEVHNGSKFYPWCLKTTEKKLKKDESHIYYKKKTGGNLFISANVVKTKSFHIDLYLFSLTCYFSLQISHMW